jgi:hypothetical protein
MDKAVKIWKSSLRSLNVITNKSAEAMQDNTYRDKMENMKLRINLNLAHNSLQKLRWVDAEDYSRAALEIDGRNIKGLYRLILALLEQDKFVECQKVLGYAVDTYPQEESLQMLRLRAVAAERNKCSRERGLWSDILTKAPNHTKHGMFCCRRRRT